LTDHPTAAHLAGLLGYVVRHGARVSRR
jgi:hypothetical protein